VYFANGQTDRILVPYREIGESGKKKKEREILKKRGEESER
jgi:hypothetical protein